MAPRAGSDRRSWGCLEHSEGHVCLVLICWHLPAAAFPWSRRSRDVPGCCPSGHAPGTARAGGGHGRVRSFLKSKRSQSPRPGERFLLGLVGLPGMCVLFLQEIPSESPAGVSRATGACGSAPPARIVPAPLCWPLYCHRHHRHGQHSRWLSPLGGCPSGSPLCVPSPGGHGERGAQWTRAAPARRAAPCPCCPRGGRAPGEPVTLTGTW